MMVDQHRCVDVVACHTFLRRLVCTFFFISCKFLVGVSRFVVGA